MESSLHRELKRRYAGAAGRTEVRIGKFRVDAVVANSEGVELVEIQHGSLCAIRDKIQTLTKRHRVRVVKPIIGRKCLIRRDEPGGPIRSRRNSPHHGRLLEIFDELIYFTRAFPHPNLVIEVILVNIEQWRLPPKRKQTSRRRRGGQNHIVQDQKLIELTETVCLSQPVDLKLLIDCVLPKPFHTGHLADSLQVDRWIAQRIAYVLRNAGAICTVGKLRGAWLYDWITPGQKLAA